MLHCICHYTSPQVKSPHLSTFSHHSSPHHQIAITLSISSHHTSLYLSLHLTKSPYQSTFFTSLSKSNHTSLSSVTILSLYLTISQVTIQITILHLPIKVTILSLYLTMSPSHLSTFCHYTKTIHHNTSLSWTPYHHHKYTELSLLNIYLNNSSSSEYSESLYSSHYRYHCSL